MSINLVDKDITITFCGHSKLFSEKKDAKAAIIEILSPIFTEYQNYDSKIIFLCGGYGDFDDAAAEAIDELRKKFPKAKIEKNFVTPYMTDSYKKRLDFISRYYDNIIFPPLSNVTLKMAIPERNKWMIRKSDLVIAYVNCTYGGAYQTLSYAYKIKKNIIRVISDYITF